MERSDSNEPINYDLINRVLDHAETALLRIAAQHRLSGTRVERWRWDQPEVVMAWAFAQGPERRGKNLRVSVGEFSRDNLTCNLESNVWHDQTWIDGALLRRWDHFAGDTLQIGDPGAYPEEEIQSFHQHLLPLYNKIADGKPTRLTKAVLIYPDGTTQEVAADQALRRAG
jgi:hypothetical protein